MRIADLFETKVEEKIEPVIKVGETGDERKLAGEIGSYVVTPMIERYIDDILEHYTDTFLSDTTEIGIWISGYFGSGKSHFAKILALLAGNRTLDGVSACKRFEPRIPPDTPRRSSIIRSLGQMDRCQTDVLAFNLNTLADSQSRPLASLLLSQFYLSLGYSNNLIYARVIEAELDNQGKLADLHAAVEAKAKKPWADIQQNLSFYSTHLYAAACEVAPEVFATPQDVQRALSEAQQGELHNTGFLVDTILAELKKRETASKRTQRLFLVLDESGQWIGGDQGRLAQLQALVEESAIKGQGKIWLTVTTHGDMGSIYMEARALAGDMRKIEGRFRFKPALTAENIELVLEDRLFRKKLAGEKELKDLYTKRGGVLRGIGELANTNRTLPACDEDKFSVYYPFFPYQVNLIPEIVKTLRSKGGRGEQMSGSTRTLLAITQDILRAGRRNYLDEAVGALVSFDELYCNLAAEGEISPDVRTELSRLKESVPGATPLTPRVAEVLYLVRELPFIPRTIDNVARLMVESTDDDLPTVIGRVEPELQRLIKAGLVALIGDEYEFLTGEKRTFEDEVTNTEIDYGHQQDRERGLAQHFIHESGKAHWRNWLGSDVVTYHDKEFSFKLEIDSTVVPGTKGDITLKLATPLSIGRVTLDDLENQSLRPDEQSTLFFLCGRVNKFEQNLTRYLAMKEVIGNWVGDPQRSEDARKLAQDREHDDLPKLHRKVVDGLKEGIRTGHLVFQGMPRQISIKPNQTAGDALRAEMAAYWPSLYPKFDKVPVRIVNDQRAIQDVLAGNVTTGKDMAALKLYDKAGKVNKHCPLLDSIRVHLSAEQPKRHVTGKDLIAAFAGPPYGWDPNAIRVGVAALVRAGIVKILIGKKHYSNPADPDLANAIRVSRSFDKVELVLEDGVIEPEILTEARKFIIKLAKKRNIDETPAALSEAAGDLAEGILAKADDVHLWAGGAGMPLPATFTDGEDAWRQIVELTNPVHRVKKVHEDQELLASGHQAIGRHADFQEQSGALFTDLVALVGHLKAIEHLVEPESGILSFLGECRTAHDTTAYADKEVWKRLQSHKNQAVLELTPLLDGWRKEAREQLQAALDRLPTDLSEQQLDPALEESLARPLVQLRDDLGAETLPAQVAAFPSRAANQVRNLGNRIAAEVQKKKEAEAKKAGKKVEPQRKVHQLRPSEVATLTLVTNEAEWEALRDKLDARVRELLKDYDVELQ